MRCLMCFWSVILLTTIASAQPDTAVCTGLWIGWNLVSLPVDVVDRSAMTNFGAPYVYEYIVEPWIGYRPVDTLEYGRSYWIRSDSNRNVCFLGKAKLVDTVEVHPGWNFVGSLSKSFMPDTTTLHVIPSGSVYVFVVLPFCDPGPCSLLPGWGILVKITSDAPNPKLVMKAK